MIQVMQEVIPKLPAEEKFDLKDQIRRCCKSPLVILAEGYAKKNYKSDWLKYINMAIGECNEMIVRLNICHDVYKLNKDMIHRLIDEYDISGKQLYRLGESWRKNA